jgi:hypothetical protein
MEHSTWSNTWKVFVAALLTATCSLALCLAERHIRKQLPLPRHSNAAAFYSQQQRFLSRLSCSQGEHVVVRGGSGASGRAAAALRSPARTVSILRGSIIWLVGDSTLRNKFDALCQTVTSWHNATLSGNSTAEPECVPLRTMPTAQCRSFERAGVKMCWSAIFMRSPELDPAAYVKAELEAVISQIGVPTVVVFNMGLHLLHLLPIRPLFNITLTLRYEGAFALG